MMIVLVLMMLFVLRGTHAYKHEHVLNVYFGVPGSGKTTFAAWLTKQSLRESWIIRWCRKHENALSKKILAGESFKRKIDVYSNVPITGAYQLDAQKDIGIYHVENAKIIIDEAGIEYNNRDFKSFPKTAVYFYKYHRHYQTGVDVFSQSYEDMDVTLRRLAQNYFVVKKSALPFFVVCRRIKRRVGIDENTHQISDQYLFDLPVLGTRWIFSPPLWKLFNSYSRKQLKEKEWELW